VLPGKENDQAVPALLTDLKQRGLLDETLVIWAGEFGRTPKVNKDAGRDHWSNAMSVLFAGGGTPGGQVVGATDVSPSLAGQDLGVILGLIATRSRSVLPGMLFHLAHNGLLLAPKASKRFLPTTASPTTLPLSSSKRTSLDLASLAPGSSIFSLRRAPSAASATNSRTSPAQVPMVMPIPP